MVLQEIIYSVIDDFVQCHVTVLGLSVARYGTVNDSKAFTPAYSLCYMLFGIVVNESLLVHLKYTISC